MAASYITTADIYTVIDANTLDGLFSDDDVSDTIRSRTIEMASALVKSAAHRAGYISLGDTTDDDLVKQATVGQFLLLAFQRKQMQLPERYWSAANLAEGIRSGLVLIPSLTRDLGAAVSGSAFSETSSTVSNARYNVFSRARLKVY